MQPKITVIGSSNTDMVIQTNSFPTPGQTILGGEFFMFAGGKGANQAVAAARMGAAVTFVSHLGKDIFAQRAIDELIKDGINTDFISRDPVKASGIAMILVDSKGENEIVVAPGANDNLTEQQILAAEMSIVAADLILLQLEIPLPTVLYAAKMGISHNKKIILNPAPARKLPDELLQLLYLITPNETEAEILTGIKVEDISTASKAAGLLLAKGVQQVIITLGAKGAYFKDKNQEFLVPAPTVKAIDTTAAGDVFNGVLAAFLPGNPSIENAISLACNAAAISVTRLGAQVSMPYRHELKE